MSAILIGSLPGVGSVIFSIVIMGFESIMYPVIFVLGTTGLGRHTRRGAALLVMGVSGGGESILQMRRATHCEHPLMATVAVFPPMQGAIADKYNTKISFFLVVPAFAYIGLVSVAV
jgi:FHS family L-fucose permease-like MFS transporter